MFWPELHVPQAVTHHDQVNRVIGVVQELDNLHWTVFGRLVSNLFKKIGRSMRLNEVAGTFFRD